MRSLLWSKMDIRTSADEKHFQMEEDTNDSSTTECVSGERSAEVRIENIVSMKWKHDDVCCVILI